MTTQWAQQATPRKTGKGNQHMRTGFEAKKVIAIAGDVAIGSPAPVNVVNGVGGAVVIGRTEAGVDDTVTEPTGSRGDARRGGAELMSRLQASIAAPPRPVNECGDF
jgi:hypothetical protein